MTRLIIAFFSAGLLWSCASTTDKAAENKSQKTSQWPNVVMYEIFVQSFVDSDGDSIGDINGMTSRLDYLQELGIGGIWLMPIMPSPSYHKYDVTDYYGIHPDYGTMEDFKRFVSEAHDRDIRIVIDMIINHSSEKHSWFLDSKSGEDSRYRDFYVWADDEEIEQVSSMEKEATGDSYNITQWHTSDGNEKKYYGFFSGVMPDMNYDNEKVRSEMIDIARFWMEEVGIDGFRLDAARHIYEDSRVEDNQNWWKQYKKELEAVNPDIYLVGEVWDNSQNIAPFLHGLPALFNFDLSFSILESIKQEESVSAFISGHGWEVDQSRSFEQGYLNNQAIYKQHTSDYNDAIFLSNHDQNRILSVLDGDIKKGKLASSILLTMPGTPYIYYGEEIGMLGMKPDPTIREPFLWKPTEVDQQRAKWIVPEYSIEPEVATLADQKKDNNSLHNHYKNLIQLRNSSSALSIGAFEEAHYGNGTLISFFRTHGEKKILVMHNLSNLPISIQLKKEHQSFTKPVFSTNNEEVSHTGIDLSAYSSIILTTE